MILITKLLVQNKFQSKLDDTHTRKRTLSVMDTCFPKQSTHSTHLCQRNWISQGGEKTNDLMGKRLK